MFWVRDNGRSTHWSEKQCNSRGQIWTKKIHLQRESKVRGLQRKISYVVRLREPGGDLTIQRVRLHEDPHTIDGNHRICSHEKKVKG